MAHCHGYSRLAKRPEHIPPEPLRSSPEPNFPYQKYVYNKALIQGNCCSNILSQCIQSHWYCSLGPWILLSISFPPSLSHHTSLSHSLSRLYSFLNHYCVDGTASGLTNNAPKGEMQQRGGYMLGYYLFRAFGLSVPTLNVREVNFRESRNIVIQRDKRRFFWCGNDFFLENYWKRWLLVVMILVNGSAF